ncbi:BatA domain-containing protein [Flagellimonas sediminis]|uniref:BatA domain-containing protein n=1 Tax=Flagellimonas sediminis TaxID=2696468 RepID=UPI0021D096F5|nr:BatA domain-containing protein [Allomuricauda sediminis]
MVYTHPTYLWALLGLLVPLAIHLWSKKEAKTIKIGSVQLLDESNSRQSSSIQLNEWLLLLLRMLIVGLVVLLMAGPQWRIKPNKKQITYLVEPSLAHHSSLVGLLDSLGESSRVLLLKQGFPEWETDMELPSEPMVPSYWQLVQRMDSLASDSIVVFTRAYAEGIKSRRPKTHKKIHWVVMESDTLAGKPFLAYQREKEMELVSLQGNGQTTYFKKQTLSDGFSVQEDSLKLEVDGNIQTIPVLDLDTVYVNIMADTEFETDRQYLEASFRALSKFLDRKIQVQSVDADVENEVGLNIWLRKENWEPKQGKWLIFKEDILSNKLIKESEQQNVYWLTSKLNTENTTEQHFTEQLLRLLDLDAAVTPSVTQYDQRQMDVAELKPNYVGEPKKKERATLLDVSQWVFWILVLLMIAERVTAYVKRQ